jgi:hypothetical protein
MFSPKAIVAASILLSAAWPLVAQVEEIEEPVDLTRALALKADTVKSDGSLADAAQTQVGAKDFALSLTLSLAEPLRETILAAQGDDTQGWRFLITGDGTLRFEARTKAKSDPFTVTTAPGTATPGATHHFAINILRDAAKPNAGIWLDGVELASGIVPPSDLASSKPLSVANGAQKIHLYQRSLSRPELLALWLDATGTGKPVTKHPASPKNGPRFIPQQDETIALIGGTEAVALAESGELETMLLMAFPQSRFKFRTLAWEGDTVFRQDRPLNFGDLKQQLRRVNAGSVFVMFGRQECLDAAQYGGTGETPSRSFSGAGLAEFMAAYEKLLDSIASITPNIVIVSPLMIYSSKTGLDQKTAKVRISEIFACSAALEKLAGKRGLVFVNATIPRSIDGPPRSNDGVNLTEAGVFDLVRSFQSEFDLPSSITWAIGTAATDNLVRAVKSKNRLWHDYWRPSNWAFLHGDRTQQPSSRDPVNPQLRFFPAEQEKYLPLIKEAEEKIHQLVQETSKLP